MNSNFESQKLTDAIIARSGGKINRQQLQDAVNRRDVSSLLAGLSPEDRQKINAALADKNRLQALLASDEVKSLLKNFLP